MIEKVERKLKECMFKNNESTVLTFLYILKRLDIFSKIVEEDGEENTLIFIS